MEFLQNLQENHSIVGGKRIEVMEDIIAETSGLPVVGPRWELKKERLQKVMEIFQNEGQSMTVKGKGVLPTTLGEAWTELAKIVHSYITCEGRKDLVRPHHLKLLAVLKGKCSVNLPALLNSLLHGATQSLKKAQHIDIVVSQHGLIQLIVSHGLTQQQSTWEELVAIVEGGSAAPPPKPEQSSSTPERLEKRKKSIAERHAASKRKQPPDMPERPEEPTEPAGTPDQPERPRKSARLARIRGRLERIQGTTAQPIEIVDEPPEPEGGSSEGNAEQSGPGTGQPEEEEMVTE